MAHGHILELPKFVWILKIVQLVLAVLILCFTAYNVSLVPVSYSDLALFTAIFCMLTLVYYLVAVHAVTQAYSWVALLVLECLNTIFWLCSFATQARLVAFFSDTSPVDFVYFYRKRDLSDWPSAYIGLLVTSMVFSIIEFILFCVTLTYMGLAIDKHRKQGLPMAAGGPTTTPSTQTGVEMKSSPGQVEAQQPRMQQQQPPQQTYAPQAQYQQQQAPYQQTAPQANEQNHQYSNTTTTTTSNNGPVAPYPGA